MAYTSASKNLTYGKGGKGTRKRKVGKATISMWGIAETVERLSKTFTDSEMHKAFDLAYEEALDWSMSEVYTWADITHRRSGHMAESFYKGRLVWKSNTDAYYLWGFNKLKQGGLSALFLEYGTPRINPEFKMYYSIKNRDAEIERDMEAALLKYFEDQGWVMENGKPTKRPIA